MVLLGIIPKAASSALTEAKLWAIGQTPQILEVIQGASSAGRLTKIPSNNLSPSKILKRAFYWPNQYLKAPWPSTLAINSLVII